MLQHLHTSAYLSSKVITYHSLPASSSPFKLLLTSHIPCESQEKAAVILKPSNNDTSPDDCHFSLKIVFVLFVNIYL